MSLTPIDGGKPKLPKALQHFKEAMLKTANHSIRFQSGDGGWFAVTPELELRTILVEKRLKHQLGELRCFHIAPADLPRFISELQAAAETLRAAGVQKVSRG